MQLTYIDAHSHLQFPQFNDDRNEIIDGMHMQGIGTITVGTDMKTSTGAVALAETHPHIWATIGVHPTDESEGFDEEHLKKLCLSKKVVGVGECGLDYFRVQDSDTETKSRQEVLFCNHIDLALDQGLPLMLHCRPTQGSMDAYEDAVAILSRYRAKHGDKLSGNVHFFVGTVDVAKAFLNLGFTLSFDGPITFSSDYDDVIKYVPLDMVLAETDAPFAAPAPYRGKRGEPLHIVEIVNSLSHIRAEDLDMVREATVRNTNRVFKLSGKGSQ